MAPYTDNFIPRKATWKKANAAKPKKEDGKKKDSSKSSRPRWPRPHLLTHSSVYEGADEEPTNYMTGFAPGSLTHLTWGFTNGRPIKAIEKRRSTGRAMQKLRKGPISMHSKFGQFMMGTMSLEMQMELGVGDFFTSPGPNDPERSHLLRIPLEIRREIYGYLLIHPRAILVHHEWDRVHDHSPQDHAMLQVCKQITQEASCFLYEKNVFQAIMRPGGPERLFEAQIDKKFLPFFRNVAIDFSTINFTPDGQARAVDSLMKLVDAGTVLDSLTFVITPRRAMMNIRPGGAELHFVRYANFFEAGSNLMKTFEKLPCKKLNIGLQLQKRARVLISIDVRRLALAQDEGFMVDDFVAKRSRTMAAEEVKVKLRTLKQTIEEMTDDHERAIAEGKGRLMRHGERLGWSIMVASGQLIGMKLMV